MCQQVTGRDILVFDDKWSAKFCLIWIAIAGLVVDLGVHDVWRQGGGENQEGCQGN